MRNRRPRGASRIHTGATVTGIATSRHQVDLASAAASAAGLAGRVQFAYADALDLPYADRSFDGVWALESVVHMADRPGFLHQATRVLRPGGLSVIAEIALREPPRDLAQVESLQRFRADPALIVDYPSLIAEAGLRLEELTDISDHVRPSYPAAASAMNSHRTEYGAVMGLDAFDAFISSLRDFAPWCGYVILTASRP
ncbi:methyltransferase domain-containing protein [Streptomyces sp. NPDC052036]|uniref:methyltransferase domain-containing protein n=1 Tax=unclassified Streptomyces TaxID=2593676 RepID=UPI00343549D7